ncbi:hypothetical protein CGC58_04630 [Capnocytophaga stomatis]|uniref:Uncharacterized protein n=1 Tax=Capnocytophaga stomatis TaxID=1848904 RepID=A0A250FVF0_9FLAO|nr:hypothetical protein CGC58_04630 [Capnocytophaga stomatis]
MEQIVSRSLEFGSRYKFYFRFASIKFTRTARGYFLGIFGKNSFLLCVTSSDLRKGSGANHIEKFGVWFSIQILFSLCFNKIHSNRREVIFWIIEKKRDVILLYFSVL